MSAAVREYEYHRGAVCGDLAYDLDREVRERELRHAGELRREAVAAPQVRSLSGVRTRQKQRVSALAVLGFAAVAVLAVLVLLGMVRMTELSSDVAGLRGDLSELQAESVTLTAQYQQIYDLTAVKEAAAKAGMTKPTASQIYYIDLSDGDSAVVYDRRDSGILSRLLASVGHGFYAVVEYFD